MKYDTIWQQIRADAAAVDLAARRQEWANRRTTDPAVEQRAANKLQRLRDDNEAIRRLLATSKADADRMSNDIIREEHQRAVFGAGVNLRHLEPATATLQRRRDEYVQARRTDIDLSFADALAGITPDGMISLGLYELQVLPLIEDLSPADLQQRHQAAVEAKTATGRAEAKLIESRVRRGGLAKRREDLAAAKELTEYLSAVEDTRVEPLSELGRVDDVLAKAHRAITMARTAAQVQPIDPEHPANVAAKQAYAAEAEAFAAEGGQAV